MPVYQVLEDFNLLFHQLKVPAIIINDLPTDTEADRQKIKDLTQTHCTSDMLSILPSCQCGESKGEYEIGNKCPSCGTVVKSQVAEDIEPLVWFRSPNGVAPLISPHMYTMLRRRFTKSGFDIISWMTDTNFTTDRKQPEILDVLLREGIERGYNNFYNNFDKYMEILFSLKDFRVKKGAVDHLWLLIQRDRHKLFSKYIPLPNKSLLIIEKTSVGIFIDPIITGAINVINMIAAIDTKFADHRVRLRENRTARAISKLAEFYEKFTAKNIAPKSGLLRKHVYGTRTHFCFRAVITSITKPHAYDEIHIPWSVGVTALREHLLSKLMWRGYTLTASIDLLMSHVHRYNDLLNELFLELINESPNKGIPTTHLRNPSLMQGSILPKRITTVKTDTEDFTVGHPITDVVSQNADFDGDQLTTMLMLDIQMENMMAPLSSHYNVFLPDRPGQISKNVALPKPVVATISNWLSTVD